MYRQRTNTKAYRGSDDMNVLHGRGSLLVHECELDCNNTKIKFLLVSKAKTVGRMVKGTGT